MKVTSVSTSFFAQFTQKRLFALQIAALAEQMARQAGEPANRPLTRAQLERALQANSVETGLVMESVFAWAGEMLKAGELSDNDVYFGD